jgi:hypothetical protein
MLPHKRVPDFFVVGHPKCGTTALYEMLRSHPEIYMPQLKEPRFLASDAPPQRSAERPETLADYLSLFDAARPEQRVGEATPSYLRSRTAARGIANVQPDARIIAILREPASFLRSLHLQFLKSHLEAESDMRKALSLETARRQGKRVPRRCHRPQALFYSEHVRYVEQLRRYHAVFPRDRVLVLIYDDFRRDNEATVRRVMRFLEVNDTAPIAVTEANPTVGLRARRLYELAHTVSVGEGPGPRAVRAAAKALAPRKLSRNSALAIRNRVVYTNPRPPDGDFMLELRRRFKHEVVALSEYLDRDLVSLWGYDSLE